jgi:adenosylcobinamide-phosphate synthase
MEAIFTFLLALLIDITLGDPPDRWHPVSWLGKLISLETRLTRGRSKKSQFVIGMLLVLATVCLLGTSAFFFMQFLSSFNTVLYIIVAALLLKSTFSIRGLLKAASRIKRDLKDSGLETARHQLKWLVSRKTSDLDEGQVISATIESVAENLCDSFVAPLIYFLVFGIPGAVVYRVVNTYDAMIGYHGECEYSGKFAARLDDVLNYIPARVSAFLLIVATWASGKNVSRSWVIMWRDHGRTESPNAGWTMSAIAGALDIRLEKPGCYILGENNHALSAPDIDFSIQIVSIAAAIWSVITVAIQGVIIAAG